MQKNSSKEQNRQQNKQQNNQQGKKDQGHYFFYTDQLTVGYDGKPLIKEINIQLNKGEILTLIGPNGAGKSTILKSITRQLSLIGGTVYLEQEQMSRMTNKEVSRKLAVVLTERMRPELMTCEDVVATGRYPYTGRFGILSEKDREAVAEAMKLVHVEELKDQDFTRISDGQRQRIMLARAICQEPEILILDEPTSYLDVKYKLEFLSVLQEMKRKKKLTVIMSLHEIELAEIISDQILCIREHRVDRMGTPAEVLDKGYIAKLFDITAGSYEETTGNVELPAPRGEPEVFGMAGGGSGRSVYRKLQREGKPFATGILFRNDLDYPTARALAGKVIVTEAFEPVPRETLQEAKNILSNCKKLICCRKSFGSFEKENEELLNWAQEKEIEVEFQNAGEI